MKCSYVFDCLIVFCLLQLFTQRLFKVTGIFQQAHLCFPCTVTLFKHLQFLPGDFWNMVLGKKKKKKPWETNKTPLFSGLVSDNCDRSAGHLRIPESGKKQNFTPTWKLCCISRESLRRGKCSSHARRGPALRPQHRLYEPADAVVQEHVVLIGSRARPRPVKAPAHNDGRSAAATRTTWQIRKKKTRKKAQTAPSPGRCSQSCLVL